MRIKIKDYIKEVDKVCIGNENILVGIHFYLTGKDTDKIADQLLKEGYADLTDYVKI